MKTTSSPDDAGTTFRADCFCALVALGHAGLRMLAELDEATRSRFSRLVVTPLLRLRPLNSFVGSSYNSVWTALINFRISAESRP